MITLTMWLLGGIGIGIFAASLFALWGAATILKQNSKEQQALKEENARFTRQLIANWEVCNSHNNRQAAALEKIVEHLDNLDLSQ